MDGSYQGLFMDHIKNKLVQEGYLPDEADRAIEQAKWLLKEYLAWESGLLRRIRQAKPPTGF